MIDLNKFVSNDGRALPVFLLLDCSGSMSGEKIETLNNAVVDMINDFKSEHLSEVNIQMCIVTFGNQAALHTDLCSVNSIEYQPLTASGMTPLGGALTILQNIIEDKEKVSTPTTTCTQGAPSLFERIHCCQGIDTTHTAHARQSPR